MFRSAILFLLLLWRQDAVWGVRLIEFRVPAHAREGGTALLGCQYDLEGEELYSVKWFKDREEFYRYMPRNFPSIIAFKRSGVNVNLTRSSNTVVVLQDLSRESEGDYTCEVTGEAPNFTTVQSDKRITIHLLPDSGPHVTGLKDQYFLDEKVIANCTSSASRPVAHLKWLVNDQPASQYDLQGPWYRIPAERADAVETTLQLRFKVEPQHFVNSAMRLKCQATIAPLYQSETNSTHFIGLPFTLIPDQETLKYTANGGIDPTRSSCSKQLTVVQFLCNILTIILLQILVV